MDDVSLLESLTIDERRGPRERPNWEDMSILRTAPRLHSISFWDYQSHSRSLRLPWDRLTQLYLTIFSPSQRPHATEALEMLDQCPNLQSCTLMINQSCEMIPSVKPVMLPALDSIKLHLTSNHRVDMAFLFQKDSMHELEITECFDGWVNPITGRASLPCTIHIAPLQINLSAEDAHSPTSFHFRSCNY